MKKINIDSIPFWKPSGYIFVFNLLVILFIVLFESKLPPEIPLYYGRPKGDEQLAKSLYLLIPPIFSAVVVVVNLAIMKLAIQEFLQKILLGVAFLITILSTITVAKIFLLVSSF